MTEPTPDPIEQEAEKIVYGEERYHRRRPFLIVNSVLRARSDGPKKTIRQEQAVVVDRVTNKHLQEAEVIVDLLNDSFVKNRFRDHPATDVLEHYKSKFSDEISYGMQVWARQMALEIGSK